MSSKREEIAKNIITTLKNADNPRFGLVSRDMIVLEKLSRQQFPALYIVTADENRRDITMTGTSGKREGIITFRIAGWVTGPNMDSARNTLIQNIEDTLDADRTRGGNALSTEITEIRTDFDAVDIYSRVDVIVEVVYQFTRGNS